MRQNTMKNLKSLIAAILILSATFFVAGWMSDNNKVANSLQYQDLSEKKWTIVAPEYNNPELLGLDTIPTRKISLFVYSTYAELNTIYKAFGGKADFVAAFSKPNGKVCEVHIIKPINWNHKSAMQSLGHEVLHCYGAKHIGDINEAT